MIRCEFPSDDTVLFTLPDGTKVRADITLPERETEDRAAFRQRQYDLLADAVRQNLDMDKIRQIMEKT